MACYKVDFTCFYKLWYTEGENDAAIYFLWCTYISLSWITFDGRLCCMRCTSKMSVLCYSSPPIKTKNRVVNCDAGNDGLYIYRPKHIV